MVPQPVTPTMAATMPSSAVVDGSTTATASPGRRIMSVELHRCMVVIPMAVHFTEYWSTSSTHFRQFDLYVLYDWLGITFVPCLTFCFGMNLFLFRQQYKHQQQQQQYSDWELTWMQWRRAFIFLVIGVAFNVVIWGTPAWHHADIIVFYACAAFLLPLVWWMRPRPLLAVCILALCASQYAHMYYQAHLHRWTHYDDEMEIDDREMSARALHCIRGRCHVRECVSDPSSECAQWWQCFSTCITGTQTTTTPLVVSDTSQCFSYCWHRTIVDHTSVAADPAQLFHHPLIQEQFSPPPPLPPPPPPPEFPPLQVWVQQLHRDWMHMQQQHDAATKQLLTHELTYAQSQLMLDLMDERRDTWSRLLSRVPGMKAWPSVRLLDTHADTLIEWYRQANIPTYYTGDDLARLLSALDVTQIIITQQSLLDLVHALVYAYTHDAWLFPMKMTDASRATHTNVLIQDTLFATLAECAHRFLCLREDQVYINNYHHNSNDDNKGVNDDDDGDDDAWDMLWTNGRMFIMEILIDGHFACIPYICFPLFGYWSAATFHNDQQPVNTYTRQWVTGGMGVVLLSVVAWRLWYIHWYGRLEQRRLTWVQLVTTELPLYPTTGYLYIFMGLGVNWILMAVFEPCNRNHHRHRQTPGLLMQQMFFINRYLMTQYVTQHIVSIGGLRLVGWYWHQNQSYYYDNKMIPIEYSILAGNLHMIIMSFVYRVWETKLYAVGTLEWLVRWFSRRRSDKRSSTSGGGGGGKEE